MKDMVATAEDVNRVTSAPDFQTHIHGLMTDTAPRFIQIVNNSVKYDIIKEKILTRLEADFVVIETKTKAAEKCKEIFKHSMNFVFEDWIH
jgi:hypothetical protein